MGSPYTVNVHGKNVVHGLQGAIGGGLANNIDGEVG